MLREKIADIIRASVFVRFGSQLDGVEDAADTILRTIEEEGFVIIKRSLIDGGADVRSGSSSASPRNQGEG